ncbi:MAG: PDDEXK nuclease domain-containing protein [Atopobiaceae bacterium]
MADLLIKDPYVLDFLDLGDHTDFDEKTLEQAIATRIQEFMLELGRGFAFVGRQYRLDAETASYYVDLVFYNINLRCHVLVELKTHPLDPRDVGQMDSYVRLFASTYVTYLPTEEELAEALEPTRRATQEAMRRKESPED